MMEPSSQQPATRTMAAASLAAVASLAQTAAKASCCNSLPLPLHLSKQQQTTNAVNTLKTFYSFKAR